jgi:hypothetical protein
MSIANNSLLSLVLFREFHRFTCKGNCLNRLQGIAGIQFRLECTKYQPRVSSLNMSLVNVALILYSHDTSELYSIRHFIELLIFLIFLNEKT